jgi:hypothetical protein
MWYEFKPAEINGPAFRIGGLYDLNIELKAGATATHFAAGRLHEFYNLKTKAYFFTGSSDEAAAVYNQSPNWKYQGAAFYIEGEENAGKKKPKNVPVFRFFNKISKSHFYTASPSERDNVIRDLSEFYTYEGIAFYARTWQDNSKVDRPVHRFYVHNTSSHYFSANIAQVEHLKRYANPKYITYEGVAWYAPRADNYLLGNEYADRTPSPNPDNERVYPTPAPEAWVDYP